MSGDELPWEESGGGAPSPPPPPPPAPPSPRPASGPTPRPGSGPTPRPASGGPGSAGHPRPASGGPGSAGHRRPAPGSGPHARPPGEVERRLASVEREVAELRAFRDQVTEQLAALAERGPSIGGDPRELAQARAEIARLQLELEGALRAAPSAGVEPPELAQARARVTTLEEQRRRAVDDLERVEGELQALRLLYDQKVKRATTRVDRESLRSGNDSLDEKIGAIVGENERLTDELARVKREATARIKQLGTQNEKLRVDHDSLRTQKDNLMRELQSRDGGEARLDRELTLEEITASEVFKTMLGNVRRTSREEVTLLHDAIASLRNVKPEAYAVVLEVVAKRFKEANVENPLAMLPKTPTP